MLGSAKLKSYPRPQGGTCPAWTPWGPSAAPWPGFHVLRPHSRRSVPARLTTEKGSWCLRAGQALRALRQLGNVCRSQRPRPRSLSRAQLCPLRRSRAQPLKPPERRVPGRFRCPAPYRRLPTSCPRPHVHSVCGPWTQGQCGAPPTAPGGSWDASWVPTLSVQR